MASQPQRNVKMTYNYVFVEEVAEDQRRSVFAQEFIRRKKWHKVQTHRNTHFPWRNIAPAATQIPTAKTATKPTKTQIRTQKTDSTGLVGQGGERHSYKPSDPKNKRNSDADHGHGSHYHVIKRNGKVVQQWKGLDAKKSVNTEQTRLETEMNQIPPFDKIANILEEWRPKVPLGPFDPIDPFNAFVVPLTRSTRDVWQYWRSSYGIYPSYLNPEGSILGWAISKPSVMSANLSLVAYQFKNLPGRQSSSAHLHLKGQALHLTQTALKSAGPLEVTNSTIFTISCLLVIEIMFGEKHDAELHLRALSKMINLVGGFKTLDTNLNPRVFERNIRWPDTLYATTFETIPIFGAPTYDPLTSKLDHSLSQYTPVFLHHSPRHIFKLCHVCPEIGSALIMLQRINTAMQTPGLSVLERTNVVDNISILEHRLLTTHHLRNIDHRTQSVDLDFSATLCIAILLFLHVFLLGIPRETKVHNRIVSTLHRTIDAQWLFLTRETKEETVDFAAWVLFLGGISISSAYERQYFGTKLQYLLGADKTVIKARLRRVIWKENACDNALKSLLEDVSI